MTAKKIAYIIGTYPLLTTTFIDREIMKLHQLEVNLSIFSIRRPPAEIPLSNFQKELQGQVTYLLPVNLMRLILSQIAFVFGKPKAYFGTLIYLLSRDHPTLFARVKTFLHFGQGVYFSYLICNLAIDEVHAHFVDRAAVLAMVARRLLGIPYSLSIHAGADIYVNPVLIKEKLEEARHAVTCTHFNKAHLEALAGSSQNGKITVVPHGINAVEYVPGDISGKPPLILAVGQLKMRKGFFELIETCRMMDEHGIEFRCEIVGTGPLSESLQKKIDHYLLEGKVFLRGALPHEEVIERYRQATLFVLPCIQSEDGDLDGIPNVLLEAMAMQIPVISTQLSAIPELISSGQNGILVAPNDQAALCEAVEDLLQSSEKRVALGKEGRTKILADFDINKNINVFARTLWPELFQ